MSSLHKIKVIEFVLQLAELIKLKSSEYKYLGIVLLFLSSPEMLYFYWAFLGK